MMRGTTKYTYEQIQDELDILGASLSVSGGSGLLACSLECKRDKLPAVLRLLHEVLRNRLFPMTSLASSSVRSSAIAGKGLARSQALATNALSRKLNPFPKDSIHYVPTIHESIERLERSPARRSSSFTRNSWAPRLARSPSSAISTRRRR